MNPEFTCFTITDSPVMGLAYGCITMPSELEWSGLEGSVEL